MVSYSTVSANGYRRLDTVATYSCTTAGYELTGDSMRTCTVSGWDRTAPTCTGEDCRISEAIPVIVFFPATTTAACSDLTDPTNGMIGYDMETMDARPVNTVATYTCVTGYMLGGDMTRTCEATGVWSGTDLTCECESIQWI